MGGSAYAPMSRGAVPLRSPELESGSETESDETTTRYCCSIGTTRSSTGRDSAEEEEESLPLSPWWWPPVSNPEKTPEEEVVSKEVEDESLLHHWKRSSGLHTVIKWCRDYKHHPAGWGALLMIHGVQEVTSRLRTKVESCAIYAALFLSASFSAIISPPPEITNCTTKGVVRCAAVKRVYFYCLAIGVVLHVLCIFLAMSFVNALNEAARDSDVIRMFARGQGFLATVKCQNSFRLGAALNLVALMTVVFCYLGWEVVIVVVVLAVVAFYVYVSTSARLFRNASIVGYWREDLGGVPDFDDPYDLSVPLESLRRRSQDGKELLSKTALKEEAASRPPQTGSPTSSSSMHLQHLVARRPSSHHEALAEQMGPMVFRP